MNINYIFLNFLEQAFSSDLEAVHMRVYSKMY